jgi:uncharacterized protein
MKLPVHNTLLYLFSTIFINPKWDKPLKGGVKMPEKKSTLDWIAIVLLLVGGLNWGLVGLLDLDLVALLFGAIPVLQKIVYILVGASALYGIYMVYKKR